MSTASPKYWFTVANPDGSNQHTTSSYQRLTAKTRDRKVRRQARRLGWDVTKIKNCGWLFIAGGTPPLVLSLDEAELFLSWQTR